MTCSREFGDEVGGDGRGVAKGLIEVPRQFGHEVNGVGPDDELVMLGTEVLGHGAGGFVVRGFAAEADGECFHRAADGLGHEVHDGAGVQPAGEERAQRHVADEAQVHGFADVVEEGRNGLGFGWRRCRRRPYGWNGRRPVFAFLHAAIGDAQPTAGTQHANAREHGIRRGDVAVGEVERQGRGVERARHVGISQQAFDPGTEDQPRGVAEIVERLFAQPVAGQPQLSRAPVPDCQRKHAAQGMQTFDAAPLKKMHDGFGVGARAEGVAARLQFGAEGWEIEHCEL